MISALRRLSVTTQLRAGLIVLATLMMSAYLGSAARQIWLVLPLACVGAAILLRQPILGILALIPAALIVQREISTGTEVVLNAATLLVPALLVLWIANMVRRRNLRLVPSRTTRPLLLFLLSGLLSLIVGNAFWDPAVPRSSNFILVQLAQWAIFVFSAGVFLLTGNLIRDEVWLRRLTFLFLGLAGSLAILFVLPSHFNLIRLIQYRVVTIAFIRAPFWLVLTALAAGQLLFNRRLSIGWRSLLIAVLMAALTFAFYRERWSISNWGGIVAVIGILAWLRLPRYRWTVLSLIVLSAIVFFPAITWES
jgi:hypothetical protein